MLGFSAYLHQKMDQSDLIEFNKFVLAGFTGVFTSINLPEDDPQILLANLKDLGELCQTNNLELTLDISASSLKRLNLKLPEDLKVFEQMHVTMLRIDDGINNAGVAQLSQKIKIALNASTISQSDIEQLQANQADFTNLEAWHNYYPRENTGLDRDWFEVKNKWLQANGFCVMSFVAGDKNLRAPVYKGLPTLEEQRYQNPFVSALQMQKLRVDRIYIGDPALKETTLEQFTSYFRKKILKIHVDLFKAPDYIDHIFHQRADVARDVVRLREGRSLNHQRIAPDNAVIRKCGAITIDNELAERYQGELQLMRRELPADKTVNVIGQIVKDDIKLTEYCQADQAIKLIETKVRK